MFKLYIFINAAESFNSRIILITNLFRCNTFIGSILCNVASYPSLIKITGEVNEVMNTGARGVKNYYDDVAVAHLKSMTGSSVSNV